VLNSVEARHWRTHSPFDELRAARLLLSRELGLLRQPRAVAESIASFAYVAGGFHRVLAAQLHAALERCGVLVEAHVLSVRDKLYRAEALRLSDKRRLPGLSPRCTGER